MSNQSEEIAVTTDNDTPKAPPEKSTGRAVALRSAPIEDIKRQAKDVQNLLDELMEEGEHYGKIFEDQPKPTLLQPGAEKLCSAFGLTPEYKVETIPVEGEGIPWGHREVRVTCSLYTRGQRIFLGQGVGVCTTLEPKYRYRTAEEVTEVEVPPSFWDSGENHSERNFDLLRNALEEADEDYPSSASLNTEKVDGTWYISYKAGRAENPDPASEWNTVTKMGKKRALVDAVKTATAASDIFTQDVEDMAPEQYGSPRREGGGQQQGGQQAQRNRPQQRQRQQRQRQQQGQQKKKKKGNGYDQAIKNIRARIESADGEKELVSKVLPGALTYIEEWPEGPWKRAVAVIEEYVPEDASLNIPDKAPSTQ